MQRMVGIVGDDVANGQASVTILREQGQVTLQQPNWAWLAA